MKWQEDKARKCVDRKRWKSTRTLDVGIEAIETPNESNDPYCGHLKMTWKRKTKRETMKSGPNEDK